MTMIRRGKTAATFQKVLLLPESSMIYFDNLGVSSSMTNGTLVQCFTDISTLPMKFFVTGESYGGKYVSAVFHVIYGNDGGDGHW